MGDHDDPDSRVFRTGPDGTTRVEGQSASGVTGSVTREVLQEMTFSTHVLSLNAMALMNLGAMAGVPPAERDLHAVRHIIDTLAMLRVKTQGNLSVEEESLMDSLLKELRLAYVQRSA